MRTKGQMLNLGITGYGRLAREYYVPALSGMKDVRIVAVADPLKESQLAASQQIPLARVYPNHQQMLSQEMLDAILIASPPSFHLTAWLEARKKKVPVFVEKPFALISQMQELPELSGVEAGLMVNFNRRFWPAYQYVIEAASNGTIGTLRDIHFTLHTNVARWSTVTQHRLAQGEGGVLHDLGSQAVDLVCQIANGEPHQISASFESKRWESDHVHLQMEFAQGIQARCDLAYDQQNCEALGVTGTAASIVLREANMTPHVTKTGRVSVAARLSDYACLGYRFVFPARRLLRYTITQALSVFVESLRLGRPFQPGYSEARTNLGLLALANNVADATITSGERMGNSEQPGHRPVAMIGVDAADLDFIRANLSSLPNFCRALDTGITRKLQSTAGALTGSVWPTFFSEKPPGEHGIYHHLQWDSSQMQLRRVTEDWLYCEPFWYELERRGLRVIAIDVPMTFHPRLSNGIEVITWGSHDELTPFAAHPAEIGRSILKRFGNHPMGHEIPVRHSPC